MAPLNAGGRERRPADGVVRCVRASSLRVGSSAGHRPLRRSGDARLPIERWDGQGALPSRDASAARTHVGQPPGAQGTGSPRSRQRPSSSRLAVEFRSGTPNIGSPASPSVYHTRRSPARRESAQSCMPGTRPSESVSAAHMHTGRGLEARALSLFWPPLVIERGSERTSIALPPSAARTHMALSGASGSEHTIRRLANAAARRTGHKSVVSRPNCNSGVPE